VARQLQQVGVSPLGRLCDWMTTFDDALRTDLYSHDFYAELPVNDDPRRHLLDAWNATSGRDAVTRASVTDLLTYLPSELMTKVDIASMAHGLECRQPFLDHRVVELAMGLPLDLKYRWGRGKRILEAAFGDWLPSEVFHRRKQGFGVPVDQWFRGELQAMARDVLLDATSTGRGYFRPGIVERLLTEHVEGRANHGRRIWSLVVLELWHRQWMDGQEALTTPPRAVSRATAAPQPSLN
jgi:asparagine synthase (glutamine-hydrolysing)